MTGDSDEDIAEHEFGGAWTEVKLDAIEYYLQFYVNALKDKPFDLWYIDAFAGTGKRTTQRSRGGLLDGTAVEVERVQLAGSATRALGVEPSFQKFVFIEKDPKRVTALRELAKSQPNRQIQIVSGDANEELPKLLSSAAWTGPKKAGRWGNRAIVFLDPYDMSVEWETLRAVAATKAIDLWYLFPMFGVLRQLARDFRAIDQSKADALDRTFGTTEWRARLYSKSPQPNLLDHMETTATRHASKGQVEAYAKERLETLFPYVSQPLPLLTPKGAQLFSLFLAVANPGRAAQAPAKNCVKAMLRTFGTAAGRRRYGR